MSLREDLQQIMWNVRGTPSIRNINYVIMQLGNLRKIAQEEGDESSARHLGVIIGEFNKMKEPIKVIRSSMDSIIEKGN